jgi:diacylglycerol kinase family enzyme
LRAVAIFAPQVSRKRLLPFEQGHGPIEVVEEIAPGLAADAVLIFGGDGTVHRHLAGLAATQIPLLAVPAGSANDFASTTPSPPGASSRPAAATCAPSI